MKTVIRIGNRVKPTPEKGLEQISGMEINAKVELIQALIPLGLMHVAEELKKEVAQLAVPRHSRGYLNDLFAVGANGGALVSILGGMDDPEEYF